MSDESAEARLRLAVSSLLTAVSSITPDPEQIIEEPYRMYYQQASCQSPARSIDGIHYLPSPSMDLAFEDNMLDNVEAAWLHVLGLSSEDESSSSFMVFKERSGMDDDDQDDM